MQNRQKKMGSPREGFDMELRRFTKYARLKGPIFQVFCGKSRLFLSPDPGGA
jgi:hypothetical protein